MAIEIKTGRLAGHLVRRARKPHRCDYWRGLSGGGRCNAEIAKGEFYVQGEPDIDAGYWGHSHYCIACAGDGAERAIAEATVTQ